MGNPNRLLEEILKMYSRETDFPCLSKQIDSFSLTKPLEKLRILHSAPLYLNTIPKMLPLAFGGANLVLTPTPGIPHDPQAMQLLNACGFDCRESVSMTEKFDVVLDCVGAYAEIDSRFGATELTRSGIGYYRNSKKPCILVDDSKIKFLEDVLGTSDGLRRTFEQEGIDVSGKSVVLFGFGKVGKGVYLRLKASGAKITVVDRLAEVGEGWNIKPLLFSDQAVVEAALSRAEVVITATGVKGVLKEFGRELLVQPGKLLLNMGAEDEYGTHIAESEVFNNKRPANFSLQEPTRLVYLDAIFALQNLAVQDLIQNKDLPAGVQKPSVESETSILLEIKKNHRVWSEIVDAGLDGVFNSVPN